MILIAFRLKTIPHQFKFDLDFGYKLALTYVKQILSVLKVMINHASEKTSRHDVTTSWHDVTTLRHDVTTSQHDVTTSWHDVTTLRHDVTTSRHDVKLSWHDVTTSRHDVTTLHYDVTTSWHDVTISWHDVTSCQIQEQHGFLKYVCKSGTSTYNKCHSSEETYDVSAYDFHENLPGEICSNDPFFYQACDKALGGRVTNDKFLCEYFLCETDGYQRVYLSTFLKAFNLICNGYPECASGIDETNCPNTTTIMPSGRVIFSDYICNDVCDDESCEDEATCNGYYTYGMYCNVTYNKGGTVYEYITPDRICDGYQECDNGEDESKCQVTNETVDTCHHAYTGKLVLVFNFTRCNVLQIYNQHYIFNQCTDVAQSQSNCTDQSKVGIICEINGYISTVSKN